MRPQERVCRAAAGGCCVLAYNGEKFVYNAESDFAFLSHLPPAKLCIVLQGFCLLLSLYVCLELFLIFMFFNFFQHQRFPFGMKYF
jgi:hypothetical protein